MEDNVRELYPRYLRAVELFNSEIERRYTSAETRAVFRQQPLTREAFPAWWKEISADPDLKRRWLARFEDPSDYLRRACLQANEQWDQILVPKASA